MLKRSSSRCTRIGIGRVDNGGGGWYSTGSRVAEMKLDSVSRIEHGIATDLLHISHRCC